MGQPMNDGSWDAYLAFPADSAGAGDITNLTEERELDGIEYLISTKIISIPTKLKQSVASCMA